MTEQPGQAKTIANNLARLEAAIGAACRNAGRPREEVRLVAVTKHRSPEETRAVLDAGQTILGENRIQEAREKIPLMQQAGGLPAGVSWHLIGHLQTNKARFAVRLFDLIHSLDSERLAAALEQEAAKLKRRLEVLVQFNLAGEEAKHGLTAGEAEGLLRLLRDTPHLRVRGLMTMAPYHPDPEQARPVFRDLRQLRDDLAAAGFAGLEELSMGMTQDYPVAIEEGATLLRIGTAIYQR